jgi:hypothetical protein
MGSGCIIPSVHQTMFGSDFFVSLRRQKRQIEPFPHLLRFPAEPFVGTAMLGSVIAKTCRSKLGNACNVNEKIDREVAVPRPGEFIGDVAGNPKFVGPATLILHAQQVSQIVQQVEFGRVAKDVRSGIEPRKIRFHSARRSTVGKLIGVGSRVRHHLDYGRGC